MYTLSFCNIIKSKSLHIEVESQYISCAICTEISNFEACILVDSFNCPSLTQTLRIGSLIRDLNVTDADSGLNGNVIFTLTAPVFNVPAMYFLFTVNLCILPLIPTSQIFQDS